MGRPGQLVCASARQTTHTQTAVVTIHQGHKPQASFSLRKRAQQSLQTVSPSETKPQDLGVLFSNVQLLEIFHKQLIRHTTQNQISKVTMETLPRCLSHQTTQAATVGCVNVSPRRGGPAPPQPPPSSSFSLTSSISPALSLPYKPHSCEPSSTHSLCPGKLTGQ